MQAFRLALNVEVDDTEVETATDDDIRSKSVTFTSLVLLSCS